MGVLFSIFGLIFLAFALIAFVTGAHLGWIYGQLGAGVAFLAYAGLTSFGEIREVLGRGSSRRGALYGGNTVLQGIALVVIGGLIAFLSIRYPVHWDWTEGKVESLTPATRDVLAQIPATADGPAIEVLAFFTTGGETQAREVLDRYTYETDAVQVRWVDPNREPQLAQRWEIRTEGILIVCAGPCAQAKGTSRVSEASEQELTRAIRSVISDKKKVAFVSGHGEADPDNTEAGGLSAVAEALRGENIEVSTLLLATEEKVPDDVDAVIVAGPDRSFLDRELVALDRYLRGGGSVVLMVDPIVVTNLEAQTRLWGVELGNDVIVDQQIQLFAGPKVGVQPIVSRYGDHPITEDLIAANGPTLYQLARSVRSADNGSADADDDSYVALASTGASSWAERDVQQFIDESTVGLGPDDRKGPIAVAAVRTFPVSGDGAGAREGRLVVVGDSDFVRNRYIAQFYNGDFFLNIVNWGVGEEQFAAIERRMPRASTVALTVDQFSNFRYLSLFVFPQAVLLLGIWGWWQRRN